MSERHEFLITVHPKITDERNFSDYYELFRHKYFLNNSPPNEKVYQGDNSKVKLCCLCDRDSTKATFKKKAHIIPISLGNNKYFSLEECDDCNEKYGVSYEDDLSKMFGLHRSMMGIHGKQSPKIKFQNGEEISFDKRRRTAKLVSKKNGNIRLDRGIQEITLNVDLPKYKPYGAILSMLKSTWLFLSDKERDQFPYLKKLVTDDMHLDPLKFFMAFLPGNGVQYTSLYLFKLKMPVNDLPPLILQFNFLNRVVFWHYPSESIEENFIFPEVNFPFDKESARVTMNGYTLENFQGQWGGKESLTLKYEVMEELKAFEDLPDRWIDSREGTKSEEKVRICCANFSLETFMSVVRHDSEVDEIVFAGGQFAGKFIFYKNKLFNFENIKFTMSLNSLPASELSKTLKFIELLSSEPVDLNFLIGEKAFFRATGNSFSLGVNIEDIRKTIDSLNLINESFGLSLRYPPKLYNAEKSEIEKLSSALLEGSFKESGKLYNLDLEIGQAGAAKLRKILKEGSNLSIGINREFSFFRKKFGPFEGELLVKDAKIDLVEDLGGGSFKVKIRGSQYIYLFPELKKKGEPGKQRFRPL